MRNHSVWNLMSLALAIYVIAPWGLGSANVADFPVSAGINEDVFYDFMEAISQFIDRVLSSDQAGNTSAISIWNH